MSCRWADLPCVDQETAVRAGKLRVQLSGDPAFQYTVEDPAAVGQAAPDGSEDQEGAKSIVTEVQRLRCIIDGVNREAAVVPKVSRTAHQHQLKATAYIIAVSVFNCCSTLEQ